MRLIDTQTLNVSEFFGAEIPPYAILSHRWGEDELSFQDWLYIQNQSPPRWGWVQDDSEIARLRLTAGYTKIARACDQARRDAHAWLWADTVCIDKTSSAELSEAINSMFSWYESSLVCYAFLADVPPATTKDCLASASPFRRSRWFTRGWTLQELIAPRDVRFYSSEWTFLGSKTHYAFVNLLFEITSVPVDCLWRIRQGYYQYSIATRMSWAVTRTTKRREDMAYCLMGLFDVNMPLLYGEGDKAFLRLQEEIINKTEDQSFLAWHRGRAAIQPGQFLFGRLQALAPNPDAFASSKDIATKLSTEEVAVKRLTIANTGITLWRPVFRTMSERIVFAVLNSEIVGSDGSRSQVWIPLDEEPHNSGFTRIDFPDTTISTSLDDPGNVPPSEICLKNPSDRTRPGARNPIVIRSVRYLERNSDCHVGVIPVFPRGKTSRQASGAFPSPWNPRSLVFSLARVDQDSFCGLIVFSPDEDLDPTAKLNTPPSRAAVGLFFAVELDSNDERPLRWTCRVLDVPKDQDLATDALELVASEQRELLYNAGDKEVASLPCTSLELSTQTPWRRKDEQDGTSMTMDNYWHTFNYEKGGARFRSHILLLMITFETTRITALGNN